MSLERQRLFSALPCLKLAESYGDSSETFSWRRKNLHGCCEPLHGKRGKHPVAKCPKDSADATTQVKVLRDRHGEFTQYVYIAASNIRSHSNQLSFHNH